MFIKLSGILLLMSALCSAIGVGLIRHWAIRSHLIDVPNERSSHSKPTPSGGGIAIIAVLLVGVWGSRLVCGQLAIPALLYLSMSTLTVSLISWLDDRRSLPFYLRLIAHLFAGSIAVFGLGSIGSIAFSADSAFTLGILAIPLTLLWIVGLTNAFNFMDGIDGIAGGQALVAGLAWAILGWMGDMPLVGIVGILIAGTSCGFLWHNWMPAKIFMGDVGSASLGLLLALLPLTAAQNDPIYFVAGVGVLFPFLYDTTVTFLKRLLKGEKVWEAHRSHFYQQLVRSGLSHGCVASLYIGFAVLSSLWAFAFVYWRGFWLVGLTVVNVVFAVWLALWALKRSDASEENGCFHKKGVKKRVKS
ncbi:MAG: glycosyltransferase family 4 protein [Lentisphaerae bacterium]|nr:glycosyltransferase family 4 protein [Lentisphaerota bacterium]